MLMINVLVRRQWVETEKLTYPIIQLPLRMIDDPGGLFRNKLLWAGFAIAGGLDLLNELHHIYPAIPAIHLKLHDLRQYLTEQPMEQRGLVPHFVLSFCDRFGILYSARSALFLLVLSSFLEGTTSHHLCVWFIDARWRLRRLSVND